MSLEEKILIGELPRADASLIVYAFDCVHKQKGLAVWKQGFYVVSYHFLLLLKIQKSF